MGTEHPRHRLPRAYYLGARCYFLTLCAGSRRKPFSDAPLVGLLTDAMREQFSRAQFCVYAYCFMPDHCHILAVALVERCDLAAVVRAFKGTSTALARVTTIRNLWQRSYYDHILRSGESFDDAANYIFENPVRAGLVKRAHDWPFSGSFAFEWKALAPPKSVFHPSWK